ncbi:MAG: hypothetical protein M3388_12950, partial [Acidobacteriota bacterium]|nr:hypothetical protein [Acidobacteriota bacterium]
PPVLTICSQLALALLVGAVGLILATPILAVVMVLVQTLYIQDVLGDKADNLPEDAPHQNDEKGLAAENIEQGKENLTIHEYK